ncbi:MAG: hypothetical protein ACJA0S_000710 [Rickettsiales bacterium]|jgi:hypothetical protein
MTKEKITETTKKTLGTSSYKNSKQKKKIQQKKLIEVKKIVDKDRQLKVKIKHLEKELERIGKAIESGKVDKKNSDEKATIERKIAKLGVEKKKIVKH